MPPGRQMAKRVKFNLSDVIKGHVEKRRKEEARSGEMAGGGAPPPPIEDKAW